MDLKYTCGFREKKFLIDRLGLAEWLQANVTGYTNVYFGGAYIVESVAELTEEQQAAIQAYLDGMTSEGEATKLALPSRQEGPSRAAIDTAIKTRLLSKSWDEMIITERKFFQGLPLSAAEYDALAAM